MSFIENYQINPNFPNRYISHQSLENYLQENLSDYIREIGRSFLGKPIYMLSIGEGGKKVLAWSQMHGNEANATHALLDLIQTLGWNSEDFKSFFTDIQLDFIFMLNPDGADVWTRRNHLDIDLNRDFLKESSKEILFLKNIALTGNYDFALNLHEQRTIFSTDRVHPSTLAFLAPSEDIDRTVTPNRKKAMAIISKLNNSLQKVIPNHVGRYSDEFYPTSTGDNFMKMGIPTILFEGGHFENDYLRKETRKFYAYALYEILALIKDYKSDDGWQDYFLIPENKESHFDVIYRNVKLNTDYPCILDIAVQYKEEIQPGHDEISFVPMVAEVGDLHRKIGWKEVDCTGKNFVCERKFPKLDHVVDFEIL